MSHQAPLIRRSLTKSSAAFSFGLWSQILLTRALRLITCEQVRARLPLSVSTVLQLDPFLNRFPAVTLVFSLHCKESSPRGLEPNIPV